jgi:hypothetical protein
LAAAGLKEFVAWQLSVGCTLLNTRPVRIGKQCPMAKGKRVSAEIGADALQTIKDMGAAIKRARTQACEGQATAAEKLGVHIQTIGRIEAGEPGVAVGHVMGLLAVYGLEVPLPGADGAKP